MTLNLIRLTWDGGRSAAIASENADGSCNWSHCGTTIAYRGVAKEHFAGAMESLLGWSHSVAVQAREWSTT